MPPLNQIDRRAVLQLIAGGAASLLASCRRPDETIFPLVEQPEGTLPGAARRYATALPLAGYGRGVTGLIVNDRPIKLEGLPSHPASLGASDPFIEASILDLYDPQRLRAMASPAGPANRNALARLFLDRLHAKRGEGAALLTGRITSPTMLVHLAAAKAALPGLRHVRWEPFDDDAIQAASMQAFGRRLTSRPRLGQADVVLLLDADPLGPGPDQIALARAWSERRQRQPMHRLYALEASPSISGTMADHRLAVSPRNLALACHALAAALGGAPSPPGEIPPDLKHFVERAARDLLAAKGRALVLAGAGQQADVHGFAAWANGMLAAPQDWIAPVDPDPSPHRQGMATLAQDMHAGRIETLIVLDANPAYAAAAALGFAQAMARVPVTIAASTLPHETIAAAQWQVPLSHPLEGWNDWRSPDGTASIAQPLVHPFFDSVTATELLRLMADPASSPAGLAQVRRQWASLSAPDWRQAVAGGVVAGTAARPEAIRAAPLVLPSIPANHAFTVDLRPSPQLYDGRFSTNAWMQECPDPITKEVWGSCARLHGEDMAALGLSDGDLVRIEQGGTAVLPARAVEGQARGTVTVMTGYGRHDTGQVANGIGGNGWALAGGRPAKLTPTGGRKPVTSTQPLFALTGDLAKLFPVLAPGEAMPPPPRQASLLPNPPARDNAPPQWAMAIDTDLCIGCNACVVACQAENNIPVIGPEEVARGRDMHWLRVDRYSDGDTVGFQPVPCMQCEKAPCEPVCPVEASVHDAQGLNLQVYNRCIGTRTCEANCPYKVRRFNFRDYAGGSVWGDAPAEPVTAQRNPDVTVRARGVMEKCTYCVQRIEAANRTQDAGGEPEPVVTACAAACPTQAIRFGPLGSERIDEARQDPRHFTLLEELGTQPRTTYLARRRHGGGSAS